MLSKTFRKSAFSLLDMVEKLLTRALISGGIQRQYNAYQADIVMV